MRHKQSDKRGISTKVYSIDQMNSCRNVQEDHRGEGLDILKWQNTPYETSEKVGLKLVSLWTWEHKLDQWAKACLLHRKNLSPCFYELKSTLKN